MNTPSAVRPLVVMSVGMVFGASLVGLGSLLAVAPIAPPIVMVLKAEPVAPPPMPQLFPPQWPVFPMISGPPAIPAAAPPKVSPSPRARRPELARLPDGMVARLRRAPANSNLAVSKELIGAAYTAWSHFTRALQLEGDNHQALMGVALCHYELNQKRAADRALARLLVLDPTHPEASILRGFMAQLSGDSSAAIEWYERALPRSQDDEVAAELRSVIASLRSEPLTTPTATARAERSR